MLEEKLIEFANIENLNKFNEKKFIVFSDGQYTSNWFYTNKKYILNSNDCNCKTIQQQYKKYLKLLEDKKNEKEVKRLHYKQNILRIATEFMNIKSPKKFDKDSGILLSNGMSSYDWFVKNENNVFCVTNEVYVTIKKQYYKHIQMRSMLSKKKDKYFFCKDDRLYKFSELSNITLPSNITSGTWFLENKEDILKSDNPIDIQIAKQYQKYEIYYALVYEFYCQKDLLKFDSLSGIRFNSGALMNDWWEVNQERILSSDFVLDNLIKKQYNEYVNNAFGVSLKKKF